MNNSLFKTIIAIIILATIISAGFAEEQNNSWQWSGWGGGGLFWSCASDPTDENVFYLGGDVAGAYKSFDRCESWSFINKGLGNYGVFSLEVALSDSQTVYAMTLDGISKSTDGGEIWKVLKETTRTRLNISAARHKTVRGLAVSPTDPNVIFAGAASGALYKSIDGGDSWKRLLYTGSGDLSETTVKMLNGDLVVLSDFEKKGNHGGWKPNTKYGSKLAEKTAQTTEISCSGKGALAINVNAPEKSWRATGQVKKYFGSKDLSIYQKISGRLYVPKKAPKLQVQFAAQSGAKWVWQDDKIVTAKPGQWTEFSFDLTKLKFPKDVKIIYAVIKSPYSPYQGKVYLDTVLLHRTTGGKVNPSQLVKPSRESSIYAVRISEKNQDIVYLTTAKALYVSKNSGKSWKKLITPSAPLFALPSPNNVGTVFGAFKKHKFMKSSNYGKSWHAASNGIPDGCVIREIAADPVNPEKIWCIANKSWNSYILATTDGGKNWKSTTKYKLTQPANPTLPKDQTNGMRKLSRLTNITVSKANPDLIFVSANWSNVFSSDGGETWIESSRGADISCIQDIWFHNGKVYAVVMDEGMLMSEDNGVTWQQLMPLKYNPKFSGHQWRVIVTGPQGRERILSTFSSWNGSPNRIFRSTDGGKSFSFAKGLPDSISRKNTMWERCYAKAMTMDPKSPDTVYVGMDGDPDGTSKGGGIFKSTDGGKNWNRLPNQPPSLKVFHGLAVDPTNQKRLFWAASSGNGKENGVYVTNDGGKSWTRCFKGEATMFNLIVAADGTVLCSGAHLWASRDHGKTWKKIYDNDNTIMAIEVDPANSSRIWISTGCWREEATGGIMRTDDGGANWKDISEDIPYKKASVLRYNPATKELWACGVGAFKIQQ